MLSGHDHTYERITNPKRLAGRSGFPYIVNGLGARRAGGGGARACLHLAHSIQAAELITHGVGAFTCSQNRAPAGGNDRYRFRRAVVGSAKRYNRRNGAVLSVSASSASATPNATDHTISWTFVTAGSQPIDCWRASKTRSAAGAQLGQTAYSSC